MGLERLVLASLVLLACAASVKAGGCVSISYELDYDCPPPPPPPAQPYFIDFFAKIHEIAASDRYDVGKPQDRQGNSRTDVSINEDWANGIGEQMKKEYKELHIGVIVYSNLQPTDSLPDPLLDLEAGNQFFTLSDERCGDGTLFDTFEADECMLLGGSVTTRIERGGRNLIDGQTPIEDPKLVAKCMVFFTSVTEPTFGPNNPFLEAYTRAAEVGMNSCVQEQLGVTSGISHAVGATPLLLCVLGKLPARPRGIAITPLGLPKPGAKVAKFGGTGKNEAIRHIFILRYDKGPYLFLIILLPVPVEAPAAAPALIPAAAGNQG